MGKGDPLMPDEFISQFIIGAVISLFINMIIFGFLLRIGEYTPQEAFTLGSYSYVASLMVIIIVILKEED